MSMRLVSTKYRPEVCDDLCWAKVGEQYISEVVGESPEAQANAQRLLSMEYISVFDGAPELAHQADEGIVAIKRTRAEEVKIDGAESEREVRRMVDINTRLRTERDDARQKLTAAEAEVARLKESGAGGLREQPPDGEGPTREELQGLLQTAAEAFEKYRRDAEAQLGTLTSERDQALRQLAAAQTEIEQLKSQQGADATDEDKGDDKQTGSGSSPRRRGGQQ